MRLTDQQRKEAIREVLAGARPSVVARRYGIHHSSFHGVLKRRGLIPLSTKEKIVKYREQYPGANRREIARAVGTSVRYVAQVLCGADRELRILGHAAFAAGLTVADLRALALRREGRQ